LTTIATRAVLLTGPPGIGKTTILKKLLGLLPGLRLSGFYTEEVREHGRRRGFRAVCFDGPPRVIADLGFSGAHRVGTYGVDVAAIDRLSMEALALRADVDLYVVDEVGRMECLSQPFIRALGTLLVAGRPLIGTIALRGGGFIAEVKERPGVELRPVSIANRDRLPEVLRDELARLLGPGETAPPGS